MAGWNLPTLFRMCLYTQWKELEVYHQEIVNPGDFGSIYVPQILDYPETQNCYYMLVVLNSRDRYEEGDV